MKNLENFGVQELTAVEQRETDGGFWWFFLGIGVGYLLGQWIQGEL